MKSGKCPKCHSRKVYRRNFPGGYRSALVLNLESGVRLEDYVCSQCGYVESYMEDLSKADKIEKHCEPVGSEK